MFKTTAIDTLKQDKKCQPCWYIILSTMSGSTTVNDDTDTTVVMKTGLARHGFEVETFVDSKSALQNFKPGMYDLLLLDVLMKGIDGFELYDKMRKIDESIHICFISASNNFYEKYSFV